MIAQSQTPTREPTEISRFRLYEEQEPKPTGCRRRLLSLYVRAYCRKTAVTDGSWTPSPVMRVN